jgi:hypothetical protein
VTSTSPVGEAPAAATLHDALRPRLDDFLEDVRSLAHYLVVFGAKGETSDLSSWLDLVRVPASAAPLSEAEKNSLQTIQHVRRCTSRKVYDELTDLGFELT